MGWDSRRYREGGRGGAESRRGFREDGGGGVRAVFRRIFGNGENPFDWALPLYTAWGIRVRIHLVFILMIIAELLWSLPGGTLGWSFKAIGLGTLFLLVLLHEYGHCIACRRVGGSADQILLWPLGGLAFCAPPHNWKAEFITVIGGPLVNVILLPVLGGTLLALGQHRDVLLFNPFNPSGVITGLSISNGTTPLWLVGVWWAYYMNLLLLAFNMLLPMYPMDAGRIFHTLLWRRIGYRNALDITTKVGIGLAIAVFVFAATDPGQSRLMMVAFFGLGSCWMERRRLAMMTSDPSLADYDFEAGYAGLPAVDDDDRAAKVRDRRRKQEQDDQAELDRILAKIAATGMGSLSRAERRWLERATERRRRG